LITDNAGDLSRDAFILEYSDHLSGQYPGIPATGLIWEEGIIRDEWYPETKGEDMSKRLFPKDAGALLDFDLFSAAFYCLSLYQSYTPMVKDQHGRIDFNQWWLRKMGLDTFPYVDLWIQSFQKALRKQGVQTYMSELPGLQISFDIDHCWAYKNRSLVNNLKGFGGDILKGRIRHLMHRISVLSGRADDPYQEFFTWLDKHQDKDLTLFFLMREGGRDSLNVWNEEKKTLINRISRYFHVGLHPSYLVREHPERIIQEMQLLEVSMGKPVYKSRQHYLRWEMPDTFMALHQAGIQQEHSLGYYDQPGFMAATSRPFQFYHLEEERAIDMDFQPFCWMDSMNRYYRNICEVDEWQEIQDLISKARQVNGTASLVFHNDSFIIYRYRKILDALSDC
jgi:hypothetical protein